MGISSAGGEISAGTVAHFSMSAAPLGWLKANGAAISRTAYANLFLAIGTAFGVGDGSTTFNLPELRGEFVRSLADGRAVDTGRALGSAQAEALISHDHRLQITDGNGGLIGRVVGANSGAGNYLSDPYGVAGTMTTGGTETRPRNVALLACIKY